MAEKLGTFEGRAVKGIKIIITKAGDGLSKAMQVEPKVLQLRDKGHIVLSYDTAKIRFEATGDKSADRIQILEATGATFVDADLVGNAVEEMQERIAIHEEEERTAAEEAKGVQKLRPTDESE